MRVRKRDWVVISSLLWAIASVTPFAWAADDAARKLAGKVDKRYNALQTLKADFVETYSGNGVQRRETGTLILKQSGKMRWDYASPTVKLFVSDGKTAYFYVPGEHQARKAPVKKLDDLHSPLRYLLGKTHLEKEFDGLRMADAKLDPANAVLAGVPKNMADRVQQVMFEVNPQGQIVRIVIEELDGASTEFRFNKIEENTPVADSQFKFVKPVGVEMTEWESSQ